MMTTKNLLSVASEIQKAVLAKLLAKGWIEPWLYHRSIHLSLPDVRAKRERGVVYRDWRRPGIRITPNGRIVASSRLAESGPR